jgi:hypothetical protein
MSDPENAGKTKLACLEILLDKIRKIHRAVPTVEKSEEALRVQLLNACRGVQECIPCLYCPAPTYDGVVNQLRSAIRISAEAQAASQQVSTDPRRPQHPDELHWTDPKFDGHDREA